MPGVTDPHRLPDYGEEPEITAAARAADLGVLAEAIGQGRALIDALAQLRSRAELSITERYLALAASRAGELADWLTDAAKELAAVATPAEQQAYLAEQAELQERLKRR
jgi:hypothetical protein